jgi:hypothetical protein
MWKSRFTIEFIVKILLMSIAMKKQYATTSFIRIICKFFLEIMKSSDHHAGIYTRSNDKIPSEQKRDNTYFMSYQSKEQRGT